jgi:hypothetical protein
MTDTDKEMRITRREPVPCHCGRGLAYPGASGNRVCAQCSADSAAAWWELYYGRITPASFYRRLGKTVPPKGKT